jgi:hypothetical protein
MGDGSSDLFVMLHVNSSEGYTIAVSEAKFLGRIARRTVLSDSAVKRAGTDQDILNWNSTQSEIGWLEKFTMGWRKVLVQSACN